MIIKCNTCGKSFSVPDNAISAAGRLVQCGSCGNKWTQYPIKPKRAKKENPIELKIEKSISSVKKKKKPKKKKKTSVNIYSEEYLQKKHGIKIIDPTKSVIAPKTSKKSKIGYGFYNYLITFIVLLIFMLGILHLNRDFIYTVSPEIGNQVEYLFETLENLKTIVSDIISSY